MNTLTRTAAALVVGGTLALGAGAACTTPHTAEGYVSELRATMTEADSAGVSDQQLIQVGSMMCAYPEMLDGAESDDPYAEASPEYADYTAITRSYCDVLPPMTDPMSETDAGMATYGEPGGAAHDAYAATPPTPIVIGQVNTLNYGGQDIATWTVNSVDYCGAYLRMNVTMTTSDMYVPGQDNIMHRTQWTDTEGITHDNAGISAYDCGEELYTGYNTKPGKTYRGVVTFDIPQAQFADLDVYGSDDRQYVYTPQN